MRKKGASYTEISDALKVPKSTIANWCKDTVLTPVQKEQLRRKQVQSGAVGRRKGADANAKRKEAKVMAARAHGRDVLADLTTREFFIAGLAIYWGEGSKSDHMSFINSDSAMLRFMMKWYRVFFGVADEDFILRIFINEIHRERIDTVTSYWSKTLKVPSSRFCPPTFNKYIPRKVYQNHEEHFGLVSIRVKRSTDIKYQIWGLIEGLKSSNLPISADVAQLVRAPHS